MAKISGIQKITKALKAPSIMKGTKVAGTHGLRAPRSDKGMKRASYKQRTPGMSKI